MFIYIFIKKLPLYNGGAYHQGRSSGASIIINYTKCIKHIIICTTKQANDSLDESSWYEMVNITCSTDITITIKYYYTKMIKSRSV